MLNESQKEERYQKIKCVTLLVKTEGAYLMKIVGVGR